MFQRYQMCHAKVWRREKKKKRVDPKKTLRHVLSRLHTAPCSRHVFFFFFIHCCRAVFGSVASSSGSKRHKQRWRIIISEKWQQSATGDWSEKPLAATQWCHSVRTSSEHKHSNHRWRNNMTSKSDRYTADHPKKSIHVVFLPISSHFGYIFSSFIPFILFTFCVYIWINKK